MLYHSLIWVCPWKRFGSIQQFFNSTHISRIVVKLLYPWFLSAYNNGSPVQFQLKSAMQQINSIKRRIHFLILPTLLRVARKWWLAYIARQPHNHWSMCVWYFCQKNRMKVVIIMSRNSESGFSECWRVNYTKGLKHSQERRYCRDFSDWCVNLGTFL